MKTKARLIFCLAVFGLAVLPTARSQSPVFTNWIIKSGFTITNSFRPVTITNAVVESGRLKLQTDSNQSVFVSEEGRTNLINAVMLSGEYCRIRGHGWSDHVHTTLEYSEK